MENNIRKYTLVEAFDKILSGENVAFVAIHRDEHHILELRDGKLSCTVNGYDSFYIPNTNEWVLTKITRRASFKVAFDCWVNNCQDIYSIVDGTVHYYKGSNRKLMANSGEAMSRKEILEGNWYIVNHG